MRHVLAIVLVSSLSATAAADITAAVIDDFSGPSSAGLGFTRTSFGVTSVADGVGHLADGATFSYAAPTGFDANLYNGISLKVGGNLGSGQLLLTVWGEDNWYGAADVSLNGFISNGHAWITWNQIDAAFGNEPDTIAGWLSAGYGIRGLELQYAGGSGSIEVDDFEFRSAPVSVPAPGAFVLLGAAGLVGARRRR